MFNLLPKSNVYFRFFIIIGVFMTIMYGSSIFFIEKEASSLRVMQAIHKSNSYIISTPTCKIPLMDPFDPAVLPYVKNTSVFCSNKSELVLSDDTHLILNHDAFGDYNISNSEYPDCYFQYFWRVEPKPNEKDNKIKFGEKIYFNETIEINDEFVRLKCELNKTVIYTNFYAFVPVHRMTSQNSKTTIKKRKPNVLIIGLDAVSRLNFHRQMPLTLDFLTTKLNAIELFGYNKVGDNTFPNLVPVLSGLNISELTKTCWPTKDVKFDNCKFLWEKYHQAGYVTAFAEEAAWMGLFNYLVYGFTKQPVTHMWGVLNRIAESEIGYKGLNSKMCMGVKLTLNYHLDYALRFVRRYQKVQQNYFGLFWESSISHDVINYDPRVDAIYTEFLQSLALTDALEDTIIFFMSDHGIRWGGILNTYQGRLEERLPFLFIVTPKWFKLKYPEIQKNLEENARKLTSHFDLHETLKAIVNEDYSSGEINPTRGVSLFRPVPKNRTCESAGIPPHWCTCQESISLPTDSNITIAATQFVVNHINNMLHNHTYCAKVILDSIIDASFSESAAFAQKDHKIKYVTVVFKTKYVEAIFEATVKCKEFEKLKDFELAGSISRNNLYGHQGDCVKDAKLRLYCYCKM